MANIVQELIQVLVFSAVLNALLLGFIVWLYSWSRPLFTHFVAKLKKQPILMVERDDGRWGWVRIDYKHGFSQHKHYGDFMNIPGSFKSLAGVPVAVAYEKNGVTIPLEFAAKATLLKTLGKKLKDFVKIKKSDNAPGYEVEEVQDVKMYSYEVVDDEKRELLEAFADEKWEEEREISGVRMKVRGYTIRVKDTIEYMLFSMNPVNLRARTNARVAEELAARGKSDALKTAFAVFMVIMGVVFGLALLEIVFGGNGSSAANVAQQVNDILPVSISQGVRP
ncbi:MULTISPECIES: hypothetical protein [unclassified Archaeoglobus]|jgi:hypothetical protein|uniref:hypothetical protein n=1 Tax=unclassified Archaeoglobus TaxID=2643606 RepID=UPI0025C0FB6E|nr:MULTISPECIES: hypothetical protein [unclassified Archaeoglobus]